jgi:hypothetical protein
MAQEEMIPDQDRKLLYQAFLSGSDLSWMAGMNQDNKHDMTEM